MFSFSPKNSSKPGRKSTICWELDARCTFSFSPALKNPSQLGWRKKGEEALNLMRRMREREGEREREREGGKTRTFRDKVCFAEPKMGHDAATSRVKSVQSSTGPDYSSRAPERAPAWLEYVSSAIWLRSSSQVRLPWNVGKHASSFYKSVSEGETTVTKFTYA